MSQTHHGEPARKVSGKKNSGWPADAQNGICELSVQTEQKLVGE